MPSESLHCPSYELASFGTFHVHDVMTSDFHEYAVKIVRSASLLLSVVHVGYGVCPHVSAPTTPPAIDSLRAALDHSAVDLAAKVQFVTNPNTESAPKNTTLAQ